MRIATACALALLMVSTAAAQESTAAQPSTDAKSSAREFAQNSKSPYTFDHPQLRNQVTFHSEERPALDGGINLSSTRNENTCWFIRSYNFEREDGAAPVLKDVTTCTPSNKNELRRAKKRSAEFVPLGW
jgi:hypothetical protein